MGFGTDVDGRLTAGMGKRSVGVVPKPSLPTESSRNHEESSMTEGAAYSSRPIKRSRRTGAEIRAVENAIISVLTEENPMTVRQVFYQLVSRGAISKSEAEYKQTVIRLLTNLRRSGRVPFDWIADNTRWMR